MKTISRFCISLCSLCLCGESSQAADPRFERIVIDNDFPGAYQVEVADVNGDKKPDIIAVGGSTCAWYENPSWKKRIITGPKQSPDIITSATADLDGDGKAEVAIGYDFAMNEPKRGKLLLAVQGKTVDDPWTVRQIADVPSIHRVRIPITDRDRLPVQLAVAPLFGPDAAPPTYDQSPATLRVFEWGNDPKVDPWTSWPVASRPVIHAIEVRDGRDGHGASVFLTADNLGVGFLLGAKEFDKTVVPGAQGPPPKRGASEVHLGTTDPKRVYSFLATLEPWHGNEVVIWPILPDTPKNEIWKCGERTVIDNSLTDGHALWVADIDKDGVDEVFAGHRGKDHRVTVYKFDGKSWNRTIIDREIAAQDLRGGDLDSDGVPDIVAVGGSTHNVIWYKPLK